MASHDREELLRFMNGQLQFVFARDKNTGAVVFMPDGEGDAFKERTRAELRCVVPSCETPGLKAVSRKRARDGFSHLSGGGHHPTETHHLQAQLMLAEWLRHRYPECRVQLEEASNTERERIADVMVTHPSGARIAFEVQYASMTPEHWQARHDSYRAQGIVDVWVFGHAGVHVKPLRRVFDGYLRLSPVMEAVAASGQPLLWLNPQEGLVAVGTDIRVNPHGRKREVLARYGHAQFRLEALDTYRLANDGVNSPGITHLREQEALIAADEERERLEEAARAAEALTWRAQVLAAERQRRIDEGKAAVAAIARAQAENLVNAARSVEHRPMWAASKLRAFMLEEHGGAWPAHLDVTPRNECIGTPHQLWQSVLYADYIHGSEAGYRIDPWRVLDVLRGTTVQPGLTPEDVNRWLDQLYQDGFVRKVYLRGDAYLSLNRAEGSTGDVNCVHCDGRLPAPLAAAGRHVSCDIDWWLQPIT